MNGSASTIGPRITRCAVCRCTDLKIFARVNTPYLDRSEQYAIWVCQDCGHAEAEGRRDQQFLSAIYGDSFFASSQQDTSGHAAPVNKNAEARAKWIGSVAGGRLLDVGCGKGAFVAAALNGFKAEGVEPSRSAANAARELGLVIHQDDFMSVQLEQTAYDVITFWDVLASLDDPVAALKRAKTLLRPTGLLVLTLPMIDSLAARLFRRTWPLLIPPVNLHYFSRPSISRLAQECGLVISECRHSGKLVSLNFLAQKASRSLRLPKRIDAAAGRLPDWPVRINTGDIATIVLAHQRVQPK